MELDKSVYLNSGTWAAEEEKLYNRDMLNGIIL